MLSIELKAAYYYYSSILLKRNSISEAILIKI